MATDLYAVPAKAMLDSIINRLEDAIGQLGAAKMQWTDDDDKILGEHVRDAHSDVREALHDAMMLRAAQP